MTFKLRWMSVLNPILPSVLPSVLPSTAMEEEPLRYCHSCQIRKPKDQFVLCKRSDKHGEKGAPSTRCLPCAENRHQRENKKQKQVEAGTEPCGDPGEPDCVVSLEQFAARLHEEAKTGVISYSARVSTEELSGEVEDMCTAIVGHVWEATGFRFTYG